MTNKEKARELGSVYARQYHHNTYPEYSSNSEFIFSNEEIEDACNKMAEYKDNEFKRVLDNTNFQAFTDFREYIQYIKEQLHID